MISLIKLCELKKLTVVLNLLIINIIIIIILSFKREKLVNIFVIVFIVSCKKNLIKHKLIKSN